MFPAFASRMALRRRALASGSPPPVRAATVISLINFVNSLPRLASSAPFLCLILCHFECPDIGFRSFWSLWVGWAIYHTQNLLIDLGNLWLKNLLEGLVLFPRPNQYQQVLIGVFPQCKEILICLARTRCVTIDREGAPET